ncbi:hypothetical protein QEN19_001072 [Hanseniaspora menglaensis]
MRITNFYLVYLLFFTSTISLSKRILEVEPGKYIAVEGDNEKFLLRMQGHRFFDVTDVLGFEDECNSSWCQSLKSFISFNLKAEPSFKKRSLLGPKVSFWDKYQLLSFQDFIFDDSILITHERLPSTIQDDVRVVLPQKVTQEALFNLIYTKIEPVIKADLYNFINEFTQFYTRFYKSLFGKQASDWLYSIINETITESVSNLPLLLQDFNLITVEKFEHKSFVQNSILIKIKGKNTIEKSAAAKSIIVGSHLDSINLLLPYQLRAPGVDDNATGTSVTFMIFKAYLDYLVAAVKEESTNADPLTNMWPTNDIEFHFYAAEEGGLLGSLDVFSSKASASEKVLAMLQLDQIGYNELKENGKIALMDDFVSKDVVTFTQKLLDTYVGVGYEIASCGYGCSDHASAYKFGFPSGMVMESIFKFDNKFTHSALDTVDRIDFDWLVEFTKLGLSFVLELALFTED